MFENDVQNIVLGIGIVVLVATPMVELWVWFMEWWYECDLGKEKKVYQLTLRRRFAGSVTGVLERLVYILLLVSEVGAAAAFIGTWILAKVATGWNTRQAKLSPTDTPHWKEMVSRRAFVSLQGSLLSLLFALLGAYLWCPDAF